LFFANIEPGEKHAKQRTRTGGPMPFARAVHKKMKITPEQTSSVLAASCNELSVRGFLTMVQPLPHRRTAQGFQTTPKGVAEMELLTRQLGVTAK
jgi:hypothetical protein